MDVTMNPAKGDFNGRLKERTYLLEVITKLAPKSVVVNGKPMKKAKSEADFERATEGWYIDTCTMGGTIKVKTSKVPTDAKTSIQIK